MKVIQVATEWQHESDTQVWDSILAQIGGHPLQSALWGEARRQADGIEYRCLMSRHGNAVQALARVEERGIPLIGRLAWVPKGPVIASQAEVRNYPKKLVHHLRSEGFILCVTDAWRTVTAHDEGPKTIWIDLSVGKKQLWTQLNKQWRYGAQRALREGVVIEQPSNPSDIVTFFNLCQEISDAKGFRLPASLPLMENLLSLSNEGAPVEARLFIAKYRAQLCAGVFVLRAGKHVHYIWGGVDRAHSRLRAGEAVQWAVMEWAVEVGCDLYDLEGIDPENNPGTYQFKKKMGGDEVTLQGMRSYPLDWRGSAIKAVGRLTSRI